MKISGLALVCLLGLSACESYDLRVAGTSYLEPLPKAGMYRWKTTADALYPIESPKAEAARLRQLDAALKLNNACPAGYAVSNRQATKKVDGLLGDIYDVFYTIQCR